MQSVNCYTILISLILPIPYQRGRSVSLHHKHQYCMCIQKGGGGGEAKKLLDVICCAMY